MQRATSGALAFRLRSRLCVGHLVLPQPKKACAFGERIGQDVDLLNGIV